MFTVLGRDGNMRISINSEYFRYLIKRKKIKTEDLAKELEISTRMLDFKIANKYRFNLDDVFMILEILGLPFEEVFKIDNVRSKKTAN